MRTYAVLFTAVFLFCHWLGTAKKKKKCRVMMMRKINKHSLRVQNNPSTPHRLYKNRFSSFKTVVIFDVEKDTSDD